MTPDEFRYEMVLYRQSADDEAKALKNSYFVHERLSALYGKFDEAERQMADEVLGEWALSEDERVRFDALALIDELKIKSAIPALQRLAARLADSTMPGAPYELKKVTRIITGFRKLE